VSGKIGLSTSPPAPPSAPAVAAVTPTRTPATV